MQTFYQYTTGLVLLSVTVSVSVSYHIACIRICVVSDDSHIVPALGLFPKIAGKGLNSLIVFPIGTRHIYYNCCYYYLPLSEKSVYIVLSRSVCLHIDLFFIPFNLVFYANFYGKKIQNTVTSGPIAGSQSKS